MDSSEPKADVFVDCLGMRCPMPVVKVKRALKGLEVDQIAEMVATDPGVVPDMEAWERQTKHKVLVAEERDDKSFRFLVQKTH